MKLRDIILFVSIFLVLSLIAGGTYAYFNWRSATNKSVVFNTTKELQEYVEYNEGESHFVGDFQPVANFCDSTSNTLSVRLNTANMTQQELAQMNKGLLVFSIKMDVNYIGPNTSASPNVHWVVTSGGTDACPGSLSSAVAHGTFQGVSTGDTITVLENDLESDITTITEIEKKYTVWVWIDSSANNSSLSGETIDVNIWSQIDMLDPSVKNATVAISGYNTIKADGTGNVLTAVLDENVHDPNETYTYQWYSNDEYSTTGGEPINEATQSTFTLTPDLVGKYVYLVATSSKGNKMTSITNNDNSTHKTKYEVNVPSNSLCVSATYNGSAQTITNATNITGYSLSNNSYVNAGTHSVTATLNTDYIWSDYTENEKTFNCTIAKATPVVTLSPTSGSVMANQTTTFVATVTSGGGTVAGTVIATSSSPTYATVNSNISISDATISGKDATLTVSGVTQGTSTITVSFVPSDTTNYNSSVVTNYSVTVTPAEYTINYYLGNGTSTAGATALGSSTCTYGSSCTLTTFSSLGGTFPQTDYGWEFAGWNTSSTGTSVSYTDGKTFTYNTEGNINLYAVGSRKFYFYSGKAPTSASSTQTQRWNPYSTADSYLTSLDTPTATAITGWTVRGYRANNIASSTYAVASGQTGYKPGVDDLTSFHFRTIYYRTLTVSYDGNGSTSGSTSTTTANQYYNSGWASDGSNTGANVSTATFTVAANGFSKTGYNFSKWNTVADGSGTGYNASSSLTWAPTVDTTTLTKTLYAQWAIKTYTVSYNACSGSSAPSSQTKTYGTALTLSSSTPTYSGYIFKGWSTASCSGSVNYQPGGSYTTNATATMYAIWEAGTVVNAERWNISSLSSYYRVTKYYITTCGSSSCTYSAINGITSSYGYSFASTVTTTGYTPSPISTSVPGINSSYKPTWSVASSALQYTSTASVRSSGRFNTATAQNYIVCRSIASNSGTSKAQWAVGTKIASIRSTFKYDNSGTNWWYRAEDNCFFKGDVTL